MISRIIAFPAGLESFHLMTGWENYAVPSLEFSFVSLKATNSKHV
ncbi:hypothetical protein BV133_1561 [Blastochloris viridis]|uniref:Uncharacterized protein n=1 Tax=Blastochloris viridis TaxID=1079 RepID=A0A182D184_BLAVI|nr:hypothetical protein BV133_1561 [Blastochloris viridis]